MPMTKTFAIKAKQQLQKYFAITIYYTTCGLEYKSCTRRLGDICYFYLLDFRSSTDKTEIKLSTSVMIMVKSSL